MTLAAFVAVEGELLPSVVPTLLTPRVMQWQSSPHSVWLFDLRCCHTYWQAQGAALGVEANTLVEGVLRRGFAEPFRAVLAEHPWRALTALAQMRARGLYGILDLRHHFGRGLYQQVSWEAWFHCAAEFGQAAAAAAMPRFNAMVFQRQLKQLQATVERLRQPTPWSFREAEGMAMRRRFGAVLALLWEWSFSRRPADSSLAPGAPFLFPWQGWTPVTQPSVTRHLEEVVMEWSQLAALLREDLDRLCRLPCWDPQERVTAMSWRLTLDDLTVLTVPLRFRHPHSLTLERGHHQTAVLQASYSFEAVKKSSERVLDCRGLIGWQLEVEERLVLPPFLVDLFGEGTDSDASTLLAVENQLPIPLQRYGLKEDWLPETSFAAVSSEPGEDPHPPCQWLELARARPFYLETPRRLETRGCSTGRLFLERVTGKWWLSAEGNSQRDYYVVFDHERRWLWAYRTQAGEWWLHGRFD